MLYEIPHLRQSNRAHVKRWFSSRDMDLFVWLHKSVAVRFQLAYDKRHVEKAINWDSHLGFHHFLVDDGETFVEHYPGRYKQSPILIDSPCQINLAAIAGKFLTASKNIDSELADFIYARLMGLPAKSVKHNAGHTDHCRSK